MNIETTRLVLRWPRLEDAPALFIFLGNVEAMRHTHADASLRECRRRIAVHEWRRRHDGYAPWTIMTKADSRIIGWGGLYDDPFEPGWGVEVGYFFHPSAWGQGYASEMIAVCMAVADHTLQLPEVRAYAHPENAGSRRVLEKAGFKVLRFVPEMERFLYWRCRHDTQTAVWCLTSHSTLTAHAPIHSHSPTRRRLEDAAELDQPHRLAHCSPHPGILPGGARTPPCLTPSAFTSSPGAAR